VRALQSNLCLLATLCRTDNGAGRSRLSTASVLYVFTATATARSVASTRRSGNNARQPVARLVSRQRLGQETRYLPKSTRCKSLRLLGFFRDR
jgi:hypothetical protein